MTSRVDLHLHSDRSDGRLSPPELVALVAERGVETFALTDHDTVAGLDEAAIAASRQGLRLIPGVELSVTWEARELHVVGLGVDPACPTFRSGLARQSEARAERARRIGERLAHAGLPDAMEQACRLARDRHVSRSHFARVLVHGGHARDMAAAFRRYLARGRPGHVRAEWVPLEVAVGWVRAAGGVAVLAHPHRYGFTGRWMRRALEAFREAGGEAMEVACGGGGPGALSANAEHARRHGLEGSVGSDFHDPGNPWIRPGRVAPLPAGITPVWRRWVRDR
ncbi:MAG TPA: PHP domain-containing protein [Gammaproteobacteria bacterium]|nr:PHP domain-containing protein [Gammaproteobacteria bacterium]